MKDIKKISLSRSFKDLLDDYSIDQQGNVYKGEKKLTAQRSYKLKTKSGKWVCISLKKLYRAIFNREYSIDNIPDMDGEQWREITPLYLISNYGRVKSLYGYEARLLKQTNNGKGYNRVEINGKDLLVHRLVALYFVERTDPTADTVDHIDANTQNNRADNLQWVTLSENVLLAHERRRAKRSSDQKKEE